jgi:hypothetical protein
VARRFVSALLRVIEDPSAREVPADFLGFLRWLGGPCLLRVRGEDPSRTRALSVLVHGNETSGARALHRWLRRGRRPHASLLCIVGGVRAALREPALTHRFVPGERDLNRCFRPPFDDPPGPVAREILEALRAARPDCLVDIHNTSTPGPAFAVAPHEDPAHESLAALFCRNLVVTDISLGALMETSGDPCPAVTVECGAAADPAADAIAWQGLLRYLHETEVPGTLPAGAPIELYHHPVRLELEPGTRIAWGDAPVAGADLTVRAGLEQLNFSTAAPRTRLGWLGPRGLAPLRLRDGRGRELRGDWLQDDAGCLRAALALRLFMITASAEMALGDCLLYAAPEREHTRSG